MTWEHRGELRADPGTAPGDRNIEASGRRRSSVWPSIAVVAAAAAFGGVIWFAYQNGKTPSHSGPPPLVKADSGPVKVKPDQPGGQEIPFQDSSVYDRPGQNGQKPPVEKLAPPTEAPVARPLPPPAGAAMRDAGPPASPGGEASLSADTNSPTALAPAPGAPLTRPPQPAHPVPEAQPRLDAPSKPAVPALRPPIPPAENAPPAKQPVAKVGAGYRIQVSSVRSADAVAPEWDRLKRRFPETLAALKLTSSKTDVAGKGIFYRVQAGPLDASGAKSACDRLRGQGVGCIVVKP